MKHFLVLLTFLTVPAGAIAAPNDDQIKLQSTLASQGFSKWKRMELDNGVWEVDDAIDAAGKQFDLRIDAVSLKTISKVAE